MLTTCELTLVGLGGEGEPKFSSLVDELALFRAEGGDGRLEQVGHLRVGVACAVQLHQFLLLLLDLSSDGGNLFFQRGELFH